MKKVYLIYAKITSELWNEWFSHVVDYSKRLFKYNESMDYYIGLYAWTTDKSLYKTFKKNREYCKYYVYMDKSMTKREFKEFKKLNGDNRLSVYSYSRGDYNRLPPVQVVTTCSERSTILERENLVMVLYTVFPQFDVEYYWFNNKIIDALDKLMYTSVYDVDWGGDSACFTTEERDQRIDYANNNMSYGLTVYGNKFFDIFTNEFGLLMFIFKPMFIGGGF